MENFMCRYCIQWFTQNEGQIENVGTNNPTFICLKCIKDQ